MMPGHEDREDDVAIGKRHQPFHAAMMPGHEDREDGAHDGSVAILGGAAMMPGHEDREDVRLRAAGYTVWVGPQ